MRKFITLMGAVFVFSPVTGSDNQQGNQPIQARAPLGQTMHYGMHVGDVTPETSPKGGQKQQAWPSAMLQRGQGDSATPHPQNKQLLSPDKIASAPFDSSDPTGLARVVVRPRSSTTSNMPSAVTGQNQGVPVRQSGVMAWLRWICCCGCCK